MRILNNYDTESAACIDKGFLESHGIPAYVDADAMSSVFPAPDAGTSTINIFVDDDRYEEARRLLASRPK